MISLAILKTLTALQKLPKNVGDLSKLKSNKSPNLVTLIQRQSCKTDSSLLKELSSINQCWRS